MQRAGRGAKAQQRAVVEREQRAAQRGEDRQLVVGPLDRAERVAQRLDLLALVERSALDQDVRDMTRLQRAHVGARDVAAISAEAPKEHADVARLDRDALLGLLARGHRPSALLDQPSHEGARRVGQRFVDLRAW